MFVLLELKSEEEYIETRGGSLGDEASFLPDAACIWFVALIFNVCHTTSPLEDEETIVIKKNSISNVVAGLDQDRMIHSEPITGEGIKSTPSCLPRRPLG